MTDTQGGATGLGGDDLDGRTIGWENLIGEIRRDWRRKLVLVRWSNSVNSEAINVRSQELAAALRGCSSLEHVDVGYVFLSRVRQTTQSDLLRRLGCLESVESIQVGRRLPGRGCEMQLGVICWSALFQGLQQKTWSRLQHLLLYYVELCSHKAIDLLAAGIMRTQRTLRTIALKHVVSSAAIDSSGVNSSSSRGILDPILAAASRANQCRWFLLRGAGAKIKGHATAAIKGPLIGQKALQLLLDRGRLTRLLLQHANINDQHCLWIASALTRNPGHLLYLDLRGNPRITHQGIHSLLGMAYANPLITKIAVDDENMQLKFDFVIRMNKCGRAMYVAKGLHTRRTTFVEWLVVLSRDDPRKVGNDSLSGIHDTLRQVPHFVNWLTN